MCSAPRGPPATQPKAPGVDAGRNAPCLPAGAKADSGKRWSDRQAALERTSFLSSGAESSGPGLMGRTACGDGSCRSPPCQGQAQAAFWVLQLGQLLRV